MFFFLYGEFYFLSSLTILSFVFCCLNMLFHMYVCSALYFLCFWSVVWCLSLTLENSWPLLLQICLVLHSLFFLWYFACVYATFLKFPHSSWMFCLFFSPNLNLSLWNFCWHIFKLIDWFFHVQPTLEFTKTIICVI